MHDINCVISAYGHDGVTRAINLATATNELFRKTIIVINEDDATFESHQSQSLYYEIRRPNLGMNIGAWLTGIKNCDERYPVVCLQDECELVNLRAPAHYCNLLNKDGIGMVGESLNTKWDREWEAMGVSPLNYIIRFPDNKKISRVDFYLNCMQSWGIKTGITASHLRTLACGFSSNVASRLPSLTLSNNKDECIAAEIGISQFVSNNLGLQVIQSDDLPFQHFRHPEWHPNGLSKLHSVTVY